MLSYVEDTVSVSATVLLPVHSYCYWGPTALCSRNLYVRAGGTEKQLTPTMVSAACR